MEFKAEKINGKIIVKPNIEKKPNGDIIVHVPSLPLIKKLQETYGKRNIQQI